MKKNTVSASEFYRTLGERNDKAFQESLKREVLLFAVSQRNETVEKGTNINIGLIKQPNSQANAKDIALATKKLVLLNPNSKVLKEIEDININGTLFSTATFQTDNNGQPIYQKILVIIRKGYSLTFVLSYKNEQGQKSLEDIAKSLRFDNK